MDKSRVESSNHKTSAVVSQRNLERKRLQLTFESPKERTKQSVKSSDKKAKNTCIKKSKTHKRNSMSSSSASCSSNSQQNSDSSDSNDSS